SPRKLSEYVEHFEGLDYDTGALHEQHVRSRRSTDSPDLRLSFRAHGKRFSMRLRRDLSAFSDDVKVEGSQGQLHDVFGSVTDGVFEGKIIAHDGAYYVEHARRYFPRNSTRTRAHSVIYKDGDVTDPYANRRHGHVGGCGITDEVVQWMERIQNSGVEEEVSSAGPSPSSPPQNNHVPVSQPPHPNSLRDDPPRQWDYQTYKYSRAANSGKHSRSKRAAPAPVNPASTCSLYIQTDPLIWRHVRKGFPDTREEILSLISHHVTAVNYIYRDTKFDGRIQHRNIKFEIDDDALCSNHINQSETTQFCMENIDVFNFLNLHSLANHEDFCLAYVFTYRDFTGGTLGMSQACTSRGASGGICEKYKTYTETIGGIYQTTKRSLNTGIITFVNSNSRVPPKVSQLMLAHEIGHNFGSPGNFIMFAGAKSSDRPNNSRFSQCSVGNISAVLDAVRDGRKRNCLTTSQGAFCGNKIVEAGEECDCGMYDVTSCVVYGQYQRSMDAVREGRKRNCLTTSQGAFCGDKIVEVGEECDCGYDEVECEDRCCYPRLVSPFERERNVTARGCTRKANTQCSPSQGPCCNSDTCQFVDAARNQTCREATDCSHASYCSGRSAECPAPSAAPDHTQCNNGEHEPTYRFNQTCREATDCSHASYCSGHSAECPAPSAAPDHTQWSAHRPPDSTREPYARMFLFFSRVADGVTAVVDRRALCQLACQTGPSADSCQSTADFATKHNLPVGGISLRPGSPCDNF
ncbi:Uncharacterized protein OBRU01_20986, partial [Operophtera brumata]